MQYIFFVNEILEERSLNSFSSGSVDYKENNNTGIIGVPFSVTRGTGT